MTYPLHLDLAGRLVLVAGGGPVATRRVSGALAAGALVRLVAPEVCEELREAIGQHPDRLTWVRREVAPADVEGAWLVHTATGDAAADQTLADTAAAARIWCVTAGDVRTGSARTPAVLRRDDVVAGIAVVAGLSTDGPPDPARSAALATAVGLALDSGQLPVRHRRATTAEHPGRVIIVGGGPGDPDLITLRGRRALAAADVVIHDRLGPTALLAELDPDVVLVDVGKTPGHHPVPQEEIDALLVGHARSGATVVRLKGGDPYVFGRGHEEVLACRNAGLEVEVIPGVTSAFAAPLSAGIPVTARGVARGVVVLTGHEIVEGDEAGGPDPAVVADAAHWCARGNTLVVLMGVATLGRLATALVGAGLPESTPAAVIASGTTADQRVVRGTVGTIAGLCAVAGIEAPAVIVVGDVAALAENGPG